MCLRTNLRPISKIYLKSLESKLEVKFRPVEKEADGYNCGVFALGYASILLNGKSPVDSRFVVNEMNNHFIQATNLNSLIVK